jgi:hypothetical protein
MPKRIIRKRKDFPTVLQPFDCIKGICVGGCINPHDSLEGQETAHAHVSQDKYLGYICMLYSFQLEHDLMLLHEVSHLLTRKERAHHGKAWRQKVIEIGGTVEPYIYSISRFSKMVYPGFNHRGKMKYPVLTEGWTS